MKHQSLRWLCWLLPVAGILAYSNSLNGAFVFDDFPRVVWNSSIRQSWPPWEIIKNSNRPVLDLSLAFNHATTGYSVRGYHVANVAIHIMAGLTLLGVVRRTILVHGGIPSRAAPWLAFSVGLLWLVHPLQTEAVTYIYQRSESLAGLFYLLTLYCAIRSALGERKLRWGVAAVAACVFGMGSKEVMVTAPVAVLLYDRTFLSSSVKSAIRSRWPLYAALAAVWGTLTVILMYGTLSRGGEGVGFQLENRRPLEYLLTQPGVILHYLRLVLWPAPLCIDYAWELADEPIEIIPPLVAIGGLLVAATWSLWKRSWLGFLGAWFFLVLAPTSSFIPIDDLAVEHRMYLPLASVLAALTILGYRVLNRASKAGNLFGILVVCAIAVVLGFGTRNRNEEYRSVTRLWQSVTRVAPHNSGAYGNLGIALLCDGRPEEALEPLRRSLEIDPSNTFVRLNLAKALVGAGHLGDAVDHYEGVLKMDWQDVQNHARELELDVRTQLSWVYAALGEHELAVRELERALELEPDSPEVRAMLGGALLQTGRLGQAAQHIERAVELDPALANAQNNLGFLLERSGDRQRAIQAYEQAVRTAPESGEAHASLGRALRAEGQLGRAEDHLRQAVRLVPGLVEARVNLGLVLESQGDGAGAAEQYNEALRLDPDLGFVHERLGQLYLASGDAARANEQFAQALRVGPASVRLHNNLGYALEQQGDLVGATAQYARAAELDPPSAATHNNLAGVLWRQGELARAAEHYQRAVTLDPTLAQAHSNYGLLAQALDDRVRAIAEHRRALALDPELLASANGLAWLLATSGDPTLRDADEAILWAERCAERCGYAQSGVLATLAAACAEAGRFEDAVRWQTRAIELTPAGQASVLRERLALYEAGRPYHEGQEPTGGKDER